MYKFAQKQAHFQTGTQPYPTTRDRTAKPFLTQQEPTAEEQTGKGQTLDRSSPKTSWGHDFSKVRTFADHRAKEEPQPHSMMSAQSLEPPQPKIKTLPQISQHLAAQQNSLKGALSSDKSAALVSQKLDQSASLTSLAATADGVSIVVEPEGAYTSVDYPDGFRWTQTVTTNDPSYTAVGAPLLPTPVTYVDPSPNDDTKPFYWTDDEFISHSGTFSDSPGRPTHPTDTIVWDATLSLNGVNGTTVERFDSLEYGFSLDSKSKVTMRGPATPGDLTDHQATLSAEFPAWTFK